MITDYTTMVEAVESWLNRAGFTQLEAEIPNFIAFGQRRIMYEIDLKAMEAFDGAFSITGQSVALPIDLLRIRSIELVSALGTSPLNGAAMTRVLTYVTPGTPQVYDTRARNLVVGPTPDQTYTAILDYYAALPILCEAEPTNWFTESYPELLLSAALYEALLWLKDDVRAQVWAQQYGRYKTAVEASEARQARPYGQTAGARLA